MTDVAPLLESPADPPPGDLDRAPLAEIRFGLLVALTAGVWLGAAVSIAAVAAAGLLGRLETSPGVRVLLLALVAAPAPVVLGWGGWRIARRVVDLGLVAARHGILVYGLAAGSLVAVILVGFLLGPHPADPIAVWGAVVVALAHLAVVAVGARVPRS